MSEKSIKEILKEIEPDSPAPSTPEPNSGDFSEGKRKQENWDIPNKNIPSLFAPDDWPEPPESDPEK